MRTLLGRGLITEAYTDSETGAIHYATTDLLLSQLGVNSLDELPQISPLLRGRGRRLRRRRRSAGDAATSDDG